MPHQSSLCSVRCISYEPRERVEGSTAMSCCTLVNTPSSARACAVCQGFCGHGGGIVGMPRMPSLDHFTRHCTKTSPESGPHLSPWGRSEGLRTYWIAS